MRRIVFRYHVAYVVGDWSWLPGRRLVKPIGFLLHKWHQLKNHGHVEAPLSLRSSSSPSEAIRELYGKYVPGFTSNSLRTIVADEIAAKVREIIPRNFTDHASGLDEQLRRDGIVYLAGLDLTPSQVKDIHDYYERLPVYNAHISYASDQVPRYRGQGANRFVFGSYTEHDSLECPHLVDIAFDSRVLSLVEHYLGCPPILYNINTWWSFAGRKGMISHDFHRDLEDHRFLALFVFLTDVRGGQDGGDHEFIHRTHNERWLTQKLNGERQLAAQLFPPDLGESGYHQAALYRHLFKDEVEVITGRAGQIFLADTYALHRGVPPVLTDRLMCWMRLGLTGNVPFKDSQDSYPDRVVLERPYFADPYNRYVGRILIDGRASDH